jgi:hypothetical protein
METKASKDVFRDQGMRKERKVCTSSKHPLFSFLPVVFFLFRQRILERRSFHSSWKVKSGWKTGRRFWKKCREQGVQNQRRKGNLTDKRKKVNTESCCKRKIRGK